VIFCSQILIRVFLLRRTKNGLYSGERRFTAVHRMFLFDAALFCCAVFRSILQSGMRLRTLFPVCSGNPAQLVSLLKRCLKTCNTVFFNKTDNET